MHLPYPALLLTPTHQTPSYSLAHPLTHSASPNSRTRRLVLPAAVEIEDDAGVVGRVDAGEGDERAGRAVAAARDRDLAAGDVDLGLARVVQGDVLDAHEVVARGGALGNGEGEVLLVC